jgi:hypothetical protein
MHDLARRLKHGVQLTTDGHRAYLEAVESAFGADIDYAILIKLYEAPLDSETRYSPPECIGVESQRIQGNPEFARILTSYAERQNLSMRMAMRRMTRLTNGFSKKVENLQHATSLYFMYYNFARIHSTLWVAPAKEAKLTRHVWAIEEILRTSRGMLTLQRHLIHSLATPVLELVVTYPSWLTSDALRASRALRPPPPRRMAAPFGASSEARVPDSCGGES